MEEEKIKTEEEETYTVVDEASEPQIDKQLLTIRDYATKRGQTYENVRKKIAKLKDSGLYADHFFVMVKPGTTSKTTYFDEEIVKIMDGNIRGESIVIDEGTTKITLLERQLEEAEHRIDVLREEKEKYMAALLELKDKTPKEIDQTKYMLIEDHKKVEEELEKKKEELEKLTEDYNKAEKENTELREEMDGLRSVAVKTAKLSSELDEKMKEIEKKKEEISEAVKEKDKVNAEKMMLEAEMVKVAAEKDRIASEAEIEKKRAAQEYEEALKLGFFARRKRLKELKKKREQQETEGN